MIYWLVSKGIDWVTLVRLSLAYVTLMMFNKQGPLGGTENCRLLAKGRIWYNLNERIIDSWADPICCYASNKWRQTNSALRQRLSQNRCLKEKVVISNLNRNDFGLWSENHHGYWQNEEYHWWNIFSNHCHAVYLSSEGRFPGRPCFLSISWFFLLFQSQFPRLVIPKVHLRSLPSYAHWSVSCCDQTLQSLHLALQGARNLIIDVSINIITINTILIVYHFHWISFHKSTYTIWKRTYTLI